MRQSALLRGGAGGGTLARMVSALPPRFAITPEEIDRVMDEFYETIQSHPGLGPVFANHVTDWPAHKARAAAFWRNAILMDRSYDGNPLQVHRAAGDVRPGMFIPWLGLFDSVLIRTLPAETAEAWSELAHRIGRSLAYGMMGLKEDGSPDGPPKLR